MDSPLPHRDLPRRMLAAVETAVKLQSVSNAKGRARKQALNEILGTLRNVIKEYEKI